MSPPRPRVVVAVALVLVLVAGGLFWWTTRDRVAWSTEVAGAGDVLDVDGTRVLVESSDGVVVLDRDDGDVLAESEVPSGAFVGQAALVPGGGAVLTWRDDEYAAAYVDTSGATRWERRSAQDLRIVGMDAEAGVVALRTYGADPTVVGVDLDGEQRWSRPAPSGLVVPSLTPTGRLLTQVGVTLVPSGPDRFEVLDLGDGTALGSIEARGGITGVAAWQRTVLVARDDGSLVFVVDGRERDLTGPTDVVAEVVGTVDDGAVAVSTFDLDFWGVDLERGAVARLDTDPYRSSSRRIGAVDGDTLRIVDLGTGEELTSVETGTEGTFWTGSTAVAIEERQGRLSGWRHGDGGASRVSVVDDDGDRHGALTTTTRIIDLFVADEHEAVVVTDGEGDGPRRVSLVGRD
ncbi:PQQ-binding-like beta-propeller repeat protein [Nocardioides sp. 1609]|uniref:PQQ-binding-like beta-propeller repeat protein n=1 Tax=Nocardioides sp. 1609 TaxID=2508327 RepID=UPI00106F9248|nr:PQQ-binding-like beta-propeller repeat protein [Nocardioides sp. 1609]